ncbi:IclR family transcriptional regulator [Nioella nitratireducens]|uniref:IclR family transcriptional regulator n=1 Tax=Nioella nitratireducens TaxID=1287720 RepID=UPI0008FD3C67|nr:IclR family transcriptional regulator [Nioella nitratireducens]
MASEQDISTDPTSEDRYLVPGLVRGLKALQAFTPEQPTLTLSEIAQKLGVSRSAAFRTVYTLTQMGCLLQDGRTNTYSQGPGVLRLSYGYLATRETVELAQPELERLRDRTGWSVHMGVLDGTSVLYVLRVPARDIRSSIVQVGSRLPVQTTTMGRVFLADLSEEELTELYRRDRQQGGRMSATTSLKEWVAHARSGRGQGVIIHSGDFEAGIASAATGVRDMTGRVVAAINVTAPMDVTRLADLDGPVGSELVESARRISVLLGAPDPV